MKRILLTSIVFAVIGINFSMAQDIPDSINACLEIIQKKFSSIEEDIHHLKKENQKRISEIQSLNSEAGKFRGSLDSLSINHTKLSEIQKADKDTISQRINNANDAIDHNQSVLKNRSLWGGIIAVLIVLLSGGILLYLFKRIKSGTSSIDEVRKAQDVLQNAQTKMQEESIKLDNKLLEIAEQQMKITATTNELY